MCGGHVNPAVTLSILIKCGRQDAGPNFVTALCIMLSQVAGGFLGCLVIYLCINWDFPIDKSIAILQPGVGASYGRVFVAELLGTFLFASLIVSVKFHNGARDGVVNCFLVGMCLFAVLNMVGGVSGGAINPAIGLCQCVFQYAVQRQAAKTEEELAQVTISDYTWVYVLGTFSGGALAGLFQWLNTTYIKALEEPENPKLAEELELIENKNMLKVKPEEGQQDERAVRASYDENSHFQS
jgi:aquaporin Z